MSIQPALLIITNCITYSYKQANLYDTSLMAAMYDDYSTKLTAAQYILDGISIASSHTCSVQWN
jgi:hypothetical protein